MSAKIKKSQRLFSELHKIGASGVFWHVMSKVCSHFCDANGYYAQYSTMRYENAYLKYLKSLNNDGLNRELIEDYNVVTGEDLDVRNPKDFNQKIQWLKVNDTSPFKTKLADKYLVREWISEKIGDKYLVPLLGVWDNADDIDFNNLPEQFVLKSNHGSGMVEVIKHKSELSVHDIKKLRKIINIWLKRPFGAPGLELQYLDIPRRVIAEKYIEQNDGNLLDYKIHCFNGEPRIIQIIGDRDIENHTGKEIFLDMNWQQRDLMYHTYDSYDHVPEKPAQYDELISVAKTLSEGFKYVRVDLYIVDERVMFGEMTFTPASGYGVWGGDSNRLVGSWIRWKNPQVTQGYHQN